HPPSGPDSRPGGMSSDVLDGARPHLVSGHPPSGPDSRPGGMSSDVLDGARPHLVSGHPPSGPDSRPGGMSSDVLDGARPHLVSGHPPSGPDSRPGGMSSDVLDGARPHLVSGHPPSGPDSGPPLQRWAHLDSNQDLTGYEPAALPLSYGPSAPSYPVTSRESSGAFSRRDRDRKSTRLNSSYVASSYAVFCLNKQD